VAGTTSRMAACRYTRPPENDLLVETVISEASWHVNRHKPG